MRTSMACRQRTRLASSSPSEARSNRQMPAPSRSTAPAIQESLEAIGKLANPLADGATTSSTPQRATSTSGLSKSGRNIAQNEAHRATVPTMMAMASNAPDLLSTPSSHGELMNHMIPSDSITSSPSFNDLDIGIGIPPENGELHHPRSAEVGGHHQRTPAPGRRQYGLP